MSDIDLSQNDNFHDVLVVGGGQAGLSIAWNLAQHDLRFVVLDAAPEVGHVWRTRWDSLQLFTPAEYDGLPGVPFPAARGTYPGKEDVADYLQDYVEAQRLPVHTGCKVSALSRRDGVFEAHAGGAVYRARQVIVATGPFQEPRIPEFSKGLADEVTQLHSSQYRNPEELPPGPVLVVGGGNSGVQIAQELAATHAVTLAIGSRPKMLPQRLLGRDLFWWLMRLGLLRRPANSRIARRIRAKGELVIGANWKQLGRAGIEIQSRAVDATGTSVHFDDGGTRDFDTVIWATGYRSDFAWIDIPGLVVDGEPAHRRGVTDVDGLYFIGLSWQYTRGSALLGFVGEDARWLVDRVSAEATNVSIAVPRPSAQTQPTVIS
ncbi:MAG: putative flavoprotein involved in transport [Pseudonocardiales bacterium]|nr:putative flavoprotein involved in transport [Pseudonocardiales bacterium]